MVVDFADAHWPHLQQTVTRLLDDMRTVVTTQPLTSTWTPDQVTQAQALLEDLGRDWHAHRIRQGTLTHLSELSGAMTVAGCTVMRANIEAIRGHLLLILEDTAAALHSKGTDLLT